MSRKHLKNKEPRLSDLLAVTRAMGLKLEVNLYASRANRDDVLFDSAREVKRIYDFLLFDSVKL